MNRSVVCMAIVLSVIVVTGCATFRDKTVDTRVVGYWGAPEWQKKNLAEDGDWNTAATCAPANKEMQATHPYDGKGPRYWKFKYSASGSQFMVFSCYNYDTEAWEQVHVEKGRVKGKTVTVAIPPACLKPENPIQLRIWSSHSDEYYEGEILTCP